MAFLFFVECSLSFRFLSFVLLVLGCLEFGKMCWGGFGVDLDGVVLNCRPGGVRGSVGFTVQAGR